MLLLGLAVVGPSLARAEDPPTTPQVLMCVPLGSAPGQTIEVKARGLRLKEATEVTSATAGVTVKFKTATQVGVPANVNVARAGDTEVVFELTLAADMTSSTAELKFNSPQGQAVYQFPVVPSDQMTLEAEPNPGFNQAQAIAFPRLVIGRIERPQDVDVYAVEFTAGQMIRLEVAAEAHGSAMDALLTLADAQGKTIASNDDSGGTRDARIETTIENAGRYFVVVQDANDWGGEAHPYQLSLTEGKTPISFIRQIAPILQQRCVTCHGPQEAEGGYRLDTYHNLILAGDSGTVGFAAHSTGDRIAESESFRRITTDDDSERMPLDADALSDPQIALIRAWLEEGAKFDGADPNAALVSQIQPAAHPAAPTNYPASMPLTAIAFSPSGEELLVGGYHEITVWHPTEGRLLRRIGGLAQRTYTIAWHPAGNQFAVASGNPGQLGEVRMFNPAGELQKVLAVSGDVIHDVAYNPAGNLLAVAASDGSIQVYDVEQSKVTLEINSHLDWVLAVAWNADGSKLASGSRDKSAKVFSAETGQQLASYNKHDAAVRGVMFHPSGEEMYSSGANHRWDRWKLSDAERVRDMYLGQETSKIVGVGELFLVASANNRVHVMKAQESDRIRELQGESEKRMLTVAAHASTDRVAAGTFDGEVIVWELSTGNRLAQFLAYPTLDESK